MNGRHALLILVGLLGFILPGAALAANDPQASWRARGSQSERAAYGDADLAEEVRFGKEIAARVLGRYKLVDNPQLQRYVNLVGASIAQYTSRPELEYHFAVIESSEINAYSTPGGYVFVTSAAIRLMRNEAELAGVLAHELGHICERHVVTELNLRGTDSSGVSSLVALIGGASDSAKVAFTQSVDKAMEILFVDGFKREYEMQADEAALHYLAFSGYDPAGLETYLLRVSGQKVEVGKTYPRYEARRELLQRVAAEQGIVGGTGLLAEARFAAAVRKLQ